MIEKAVILCGGLATRFLPISKSVPKEMLPIGNKPVLHYIVENLSNAGIKQILIVLGRGKESVPNYFDKNIELRNRLAEKNDFEMLKNLDKLENLTQIFYVRQDLPLGTAYSLSFAEKFANKEPFFLSFGDEIVFENSLEKDLICEFEKTQKSVISMQKIKRSDCQKYGIIDFFEENGHNLVKKIVEKPKFVINNLPFAYMGGAVFTCEIFKAIKEIKSQNGEFLLTDALNLLAKKHRLYAKEILGKRFDLGSPLGLNEANIYYALHDKTHKKELISFMKKVLKDKNL